MEIVLFMVTATLVFCLLCNSTSGNECTNTPTYLSSHTFRYELLASKNESWREEMYSIYHVTPTDDSTWSSLLPRKMLKEEDEFEWMMMYRKMKNEGVMKKSGSTFLKEVSLHDVRLDLASLHGRAQQTNLEYLLMLDVDRMVWSFRVTSDLETVGKAYGGWENPNQELRGHFVGHYLSASAKMWASTHNETLKEKMLALVSALAACQDNMGTGYLSAFPSELFDRFEAIQPVWAPYYTIHKIMAGLLDQYTLAGNDEALKMMMWMVEYFYNRVRNVIIKYGVEKHWRTLNEEVGGMNDVLYQLYAITGDFKHLLLAHLFDKPCFLGLLAIEADDISGFHANTHIPIVVGAQMRYEVTGDPLYKSMGTFFMDIVNSSHSYATGGTSVEEFWRDSKRMASDLETENEESCTTYNMLKVSRYLLRWTKEMAYADYYERALTNGVLGIQRGTDPGIMIYMLPLGRGVSKAHTYHGWGTKFDSFWCCYGTGIESFSKLGDSIYFEEEGSVPGLYIIQYVSSSLDWKSGQIVLNQEVDPFSSWDPYVRAEFTFSSQKGSGQSSRLNFRIPIWTHSIGIKATLNGQILHMPAPGNVLSVTRRWRATDKLTLEFPLSLRTEPIKDDRPELASIQAILYGPYVLAGYSDGDWDIGPNSAASLSDWLTPVPSSYNSHLVSLTQKIGDSTIVLTNTNQSLDMKKYPKSGTDSSLHATFRLVFPTSTPSNFDLKDAIGKSVMLEPFNLPGMLLAHQGNEKNLAVASSTVDKKYCVFNIVPGLDGNADSVSLESKSQKGCFVNYKSEEGVKLSCTSFDLAASFVLKKGLSKYHPISFVAKGKRRNFILSPLQSLRDESYTVYFNIHNDIHE